MIWGYHYFWKHPHGRSFPNIWDTILTEKNPKPEACPRGPLRAVTAYQLFDLFDFFQAVSGWKHDKGVSPVVVFYQGVSEDVEKRVFLGGGVGVWVVEKSSCWVSFLWFFWWWRAVTNKTHPSFVKTFGIEKKLMDLKCQNESSDLFDLEEHKDN